MSLFRLVVGLGNPGREYADTRHNAGYMVVDRLAAQAGSPWQRERRWRSEVAKAGGVLLCKPQTYMNLSGEAVHPLAQYYQIAPDQVLVVLDDFALPLGRLRLREKGSAGGHNGLASVITHLGTPAVPRLRIGIGAAQEAVVDYVLGRFALDEQEALGQTLTRAEAAIACAQTHGLAAAMNQFN